MKKFLYLLAFTMLLLGSCAKETVYIDPAADQSFSLGGTSWNLVAATSYFYFGQEKFDMDLYALMPTCAKDDLMIFNKDNTIIGSYGSLRCGNESTAYPDFGTWKLSSDKKTLEISSRAFNVVGTDMLKCEVLALNENNLQIRYETTANGLTSTTTSSYKRIK